MKIGIDFDNTVVCYDGVFEALAREENILSPSVRPTKGAVRDELRRQGKEERWIEIQGLVYGARMKDASPFPGIKEFLATAKAEGAETFIISHKTRFPFRGPQFDLHESAYEWLKAQGIYDRANPKAFPHVFLELTKEAKLARIADLGCEVFIDDLPEFLGEKEFPEAAKRFLFDPNGDHPESSIYSRVSSWEALSTQLLSHKRG
jgi:hypothetical protein